jgi:uncharacterized small protein (DUF1192 family)
MVAALHILHFTISLAYLDAVLNQTGFMRKMLLLLFTLSYIGCYAQGAFYVPYTPITKAKPIDTAGAIAKADAEGLERYQNYKRGIDKILSERVLSVDMLPVDKVALQNEFSRLRAQHDKEMASNGASALSSYKFDQYNRAFDEHVFNTAVIQKAKTTYTRVLSWEGYLRDKGLLDSPYVNAKGPTDLTNRQALSILYGTDTEVFLKLGWE